MEKYKNKNILVIGLGVSGFAAAELLAKKGFNVRVTDSSNSVQVEQRSKLIREKYNIQVELGRHSSEFCMGCDLIVVSPGVSLDQFYAKELLSKITPVISELELGYKFCKAPIIAITGTNGKTTTTELIGSILEKAGHKPIICGNIGNPLCGEIYRIRKENIIVLEVSSFQLEFIEEFCPFIGVLLNIAEDHFDRHGGYDEYKRSKLDLFKNQTEQCWAVVFSELEEDLFSKIKPNVLYFGEGDGDARVNATNIFIKGKNGEHPFVDSANIFLRGVHNMYNIAAAILVSKVLAIPENIVKNVISSFVPPFHRFQKLGIFNGVQYIDDSKATNIDATRVALESLGNKVLLIAGGKDKGGDYSSICKLIQEKVKTLILIGEAKEEMKLAYNNYTNIIEVTDMIQAVKTAANFAEFGDVVMLSPMCSSFDMFSSYKHRGEVFQAAVKEITELHF